MKNLLLMLFVIPLFFTLSCTSEKYVVDEPKAPIPEWISNVPEEDENYLYFVGRKTRVLTYESGVDDSFQNALSKISQMIQLTEYKQQSRIMNDVIVLRVGRGFSLAHHHEVDGLGFNDGLSERNQ